MSDARRLEALQAAAALHPLSAACVAVSDAALSELAAEVAQACVRETSVLEPCGATLVALLEGAQGTMAGGGATVSAPLHALLTLEAETADVRAQQAREVLAAAAGVGGGDVFGKRPKAVCDSLVCTNCGAQLASNRFAPHLEKCLLGKGRASARNARDAMTKQALDEASR